MIWPTFVSFGVFQIHIDLIFKWLIFLEVFLLYQYFPFDSKPVRLNLDRVGMVVKKSVIFYPLEIQYTLKLFWFMHWMTINNKYH